jgi:serine/threonine protein phosphatase 1
MATAFDEIYLGHTPTTNWQTDQPMKAFNIYNLDTGAGHSGRLTIMDIDSKAYWQSDPMAELYAQI